VTGNPLIVAERIETSEGPMLAAFSARGLAALSRGDDLGRFVAETTRRFPQAAWRERAGSEARELEDQLDEYLAGERRSFEVQLDLDGAAPFDRRVLRATLAIPYGETLTYGELAAQLGHPGAARAVGNSLARCPIAIVVPCHRVVRAADGLSGWGANLAEKRRLLELERTVSLRHSRENVRSRATPG
jgi:methylated-DNA-[protein]-cysteine S-methyltransferase